MLIDQFEYDGRTLSLYKEGEVYRYEVETLDEEVEICIYEYFEDSYEALMWFWKESEDYIKEHS
jgi:hypothetical protein